MNVFHYFDAGLRKHFEVETRRRIVEAHMRAAHQRAKSTSNVDKRFPIDCGVLREKMDLVEFRQ